MWPNANVISLLKDGDFSERTKQKLLDLFPISTEESLIYFRF
jgi:hypothetical protein